MIDLLSPTQAAVFQGLLGIVDLAPVYDHVPQGTEPNFVCIGAITGTNEGTKEDPRTEYEVEIHSVYRGTDRGDLLAIMHQVRGLELEELSADGINFWSAEFVSEAASSAGPDGVTYAGITTFAVSAEPA